MTLEEQRRILIEYLKAKLAVEDWHGVRDCAVDIEIVETRIEERDNHAA